MQPNVQCTLIRQLTKISKSNVCSSDEFIATVPPTLGWMFILSP